MHQPTRNRRNQQAPRLYPINHFYSGQHFVMDQQMPPENRTLQYKDYTYPWDAKKKTTLAECMCAFLNTQGGNILIGVKETRNFRRLVHGKKYSQKQKQQIVKDVTLLLQSISLIPVTNSLYQIQFIPVFNAHFVSSAKVSNYVIKIKIKRGWLNDHNIVYNTNGQYFFRAQNQVKSYKQEKDLLDVVEWRRHYLKQLKLKYEQKKQNQIQRRNIQRNITNQNKIDQTSNNKLSQSNFNRPSIKKELLKDNKQNQPKHNWFIKIVINFCKAFD